MESLPLLRFLIAGQLRRDYILTQNGKAYLDIPGGNLLYAAGGMGVWSKDAGLIARASLDYPREWLEKFSRYGFDTNGVYYLDENLDQRFFVAYTDTDSANHENPVSHFSRLNLPFPKSLLGYAPPVLDKDSRNIPSLFTIRAGDIPENYLEAGAVHLCPMDFLSHTLLPLKLREGQTSVITLDPSSGYMNPLYWDHIPEVVKGITALLTSEQKLKNLFAGRSTDAWEMSEALCNLGCEIVVIRCGARGQYVYIHANHSRWMIPAYPTNCIDPTGAGSSFCGGFLAGYRMNYDPIRAALYGNISASLTIEGTGPAYAIDSLPGLAQARLEALQNTIRRV